jgi:hypothetical protein
MRCSVVGGWLDFHSLVGGFGAEKYSKIQTPVFGMKLVAEAFVFAVETVRFVILILCIVC